MASHHARQFPFLMKRTIILPGLTLAAVFIFLSIMSTRLDLPDTPGRGPYPLLGQFLFFQLYVGIALLGLLARLAFLNIKWLWPCIGILEAMAAWLCGIGIYSWGQLKDDGLVGFFLFAPIFTAPSFLISIVIYYLIILMIKNLNRSRSIAKNVLSMLYILYLSIFILLLSLGL